jgi:pimeloyl-ACP methyl ester carboxylesterase
VEDIERVRIAFGDQRLSVYGISYGTKVMGLYATIFSDKVNLMVLDGNDGMFSLAPVPYSCVVSFCCASQGIAHCSLRSYIVCNLKIQTLTLSRMRLI